MRGQGALYLVLYTISTAHRLAARRVDLGLPDVAAALRAAHNAAHLPPLLPRHTMNLLRHLEQGRLRVVVVQAGRVYDVCVVGWWVVGWCVVRGAWCVVRGVWCVFTDLIWSPLNSHRF